MLFGGKLESYIWAEYIFSFHSDHYVLYYVKVESQILTLSVFELRAFNELMRYLNEFDSEF